MNIKYNKVQTMKLNIFNMKKKGFIDGFSLVAFIVVVSSLVSATFFLIQDEQIDISNYYVGDGNTNKFYDSDCINKIPISKLIFFKSKELAEAYNFNYTKCSK